MLELFFLACLVRLIRIRRHGLSRHTILALDPAAEIYELAPF